MSSLDTILIWGALGLIVLIPAALYGFLLWRQSRAVLRSMIALRDRIDRSDDSLR